MKISKAIGAAAALGLLAAGFAAAPAQAATADVTVTATVHNHPDNGHGTPSHWADLDFVRTMKIHDNGDGTYKVSSTDKGTLTTRKGAGTPNGAGGTISRSLKGTFASTGDGTITGTLDPNYQDADGKTFDTKNGPAFTSEGWAKSFFNSSASGSPFSGGYAFTYATADEKWVDSSTNNDGKDPSAGNITGKLSSILTVANKCRVSKTDKRNRWTVTNKQGDRARTATYWVYYKTSGWTNAAQVTVDPAQSKVITTPYGGQLAVHYYDGYTVLRKVYATSNAKILC